MNQATVGYKCNCVPWNNFLQYNYRKRSNIATLEEENDGLSIPRTSKINQLQASLHLDLWNFIIFGNLGIMPACGKP